jgi:uncharacterized protein YbjT (DUF2867 family)
MMRIALIAGATGLVGRQVLDLLLQDNQYHQVIALSRALLTASHPKLKNVILQAGEWQKLDDVVADDIFCCLGTTIRQAKTKAAFQQVDYEYPVALARAGFKNGAQQFLLISSLGAHAASRIFYNRVKGETEAAIRSVGFRSVHILRPSLLLGHRAEYRSGEEAAKWFYKIFGFVIPPRYKAIDSAKVARAMVALAKQQQPGFFIHESEELQRY